MSPVITSNMPILAATDFSEDSKAALVWACGYAECINAQVIVLHVVHDLAAHPGFYVSKKTDPLQTMQDVAETMMTEFLDGLKIEHPELTALAEAEVQVIPGLPATRIVEIAVLLQAGLLAIGSRGIECPPHALLGSVAERVVELATIPVVVAKSETHGVLKKKEKKRLEKKLKKDRKKLKSWLGLTKNGGAADHIDE